MADDFEAPDSELVDPESNFGINTKFDFNKILLIGIYKIIVSFHAKDLDSIKSSIDVLDDLLSPYVVDDITLMEEKEAINKKYDEELKAVMPDENGEFENKAESYKFEDLQYTRFRMLFRFLCKVMREANIYPSQSMSEVVR